MTKGLRAQTCDLKFGSNTYGVMERKRVIILGASSGIGHEVARLFIKQGWTVGVATRRLDKLADLKNNALERVFTARIDVTYFHSSGIGWKNPTLEAEKEIKTMETNATGFTRMVGAAYRYFAAKGGGHIVCITSIAGTKGLGSAPAYSATKAMQNTYLQALEQLAARKRHNIIFTDIRPGFVNTPLLTDSENFPMLMTTEQVARSIMKAIRHRRHVCIIDTRWRILTFFWQLIPNWLWRRMKLS